MRTRLFRPVYGIALVLAVVGIAVALNGTQAGEKAAPAETVAAAEESGGGDMVQVRVFGPDGKLTEPVETPRVERSEEEWRESLSPKAYEVVREKGTEPPNTGELLKNKRDGYYVCAACGLPVFDSTTKFESGTGWPSFFKPVDEANIAEETDTSYFMTRTEVLCARCEGHLGHVFDDGPEPTGLRYCMNSVSLNFVPREEAKQHAEAVVAAAATVSGGSGAKSTESKVGDQMPMPAKDTALSSAPGEAKAVFAGGCFWCTEAVFQELDGVKGAVSGYCGGDPARANYRAVTTGTTGHAESVEITYDPSKVTYGALLRIFFATHNPMTLNKQGPDHGEQYRSAIFYASEEQKEVAEAYIKQLTEAKAFPKPIVTTLEEMTQFFPAEEYHQDFADKNPDYPYVKMWLPEKMEKLEKLK